MSTHGDGKRGLLRIMAAIPRELVHGQEMDARRNAAVSQFPLIRVAVSTCTYLVIRPIFGDVTEAQAAASTDRFASEVLPHLTALTPTS